MNANTNTPANAVVDSYFEAVGQNDLAALESIVGDDFIQYPPPVGVHQDRQTFVEEWRQRISENPDHALKYERSHQICETVETGPRAGSWVHEWGTYQRSDGGLTFRLSASFQIRDGQIVAIHAYFDRLDIMTQAGFTLTPPNA